MKNYITIIFLVVISFSSAAQLITDQRYEIEHKFTESDYTVFSAEESGLIMFRETDDYEKGKNFWEVKILDTLLDIRFEHRVLLDTDYRLLGYSKTDYLFSLLFRDGMHEKSDYALLVIHLFEEKYEEYVIENEIDFNLTHFISIENHVVLGGNVNNKPTLIHYSTQEEKVKVLPGLYRTDTEIVDIQPNKNGTFNVVFIETENLKFNQKLIVRVFSPSGEILIESSAEFPEDHRVHTGTTNQLEGNNLIVIGTYGIKNNKLSQGLFFINVRPGKDNYVKLIDYTKLNDFFNHLNDRRSARIKEKIKESDPQDPYEFKTYFNVWDLEEKGDKFYVYGEIIDPEYSSSPNNVYERYPFSPYQNYDRYDRFGNYGRYYTTRHSLINSNEIVSVKFRSGVLICLNSNGNVVHDLQADIENMESTTLEQLAGYAVTDNNYHIIYKDEEELHVTSYNTEEHSKQDSVITIISPDAKTIIRDEIDKGKIEFWYGNHFFLWGYERIKNLEEGRNRIFYINKVKVQ